MFHTRDAKYTDRELIDGERKSKTQEGLILRFFKDHPNEVFSPFDIQDRFPHWQITSIRRSITDLCNEGKLEKTDIRTKGKLGMSNSTWKYKPETVPAQMEIFQ